MKLLLLLFAAAGPQHFYDLGGPCASAMQPGVMARRDMPTSDEVEIARSNVRGGCGIEYRWLQLAVALVHAGRAGEASRVMQEMDARGFELSPSLIQPQAPDLARFIASAEFRASEIGGKIDRLKRISDERRARYRDRLAHLPPSARPATRYVAKPACPFECCRFGKWTSTEAVELVDAPGSQRVVARIRKGTVVTAITGEVHLEPEPVVVLQNQGALRQGAIAFLLDNVGEGFANFYQDGKLDQEFAGISQYCFHPSETCWGETLLPPGSVKPPVWWVQIRVAGGLRGWTSHAERFDGKDGCG